MRHSDISDDVATKLAVKAEEMLKEIQELQRIFDIRRDEESARWHTIRNLGEIWTILNDLSPDRLRGYGQMKTEESKLLTVYLRKMNAMRDDMERMLSK